MTTAERLEKRGELNGAADILLELLTLKFGTLPEHVSTTVRGGTIEQLRAWTADALATEQLDDIF